MRGRAWVLGLLAVAACSGGGHEASSDNPLTSISARSRHLEFEGVVYADEGWTDTDILSVVHQQTQTALGPLRIANIGVNKRELTGVDPATFVKTKVTMKDPSQPNAPGTPKTRVTYRYVDDAVVPVSMKDRSSLAIALMGSGYATKGDRILTECTADDDMAKEQVSKDRAYYVFDPSLPKCQTAMKAEAEAIAADREKLQSPSNEVTQSEVNRLYLPITVSLGANATTDGATYPEYDRLYTQGVDPGNLVIGLVNGLMDDGQTTMWDDSGTGEWMATLREVFRARPFSLVNVDPPEDIFSYTLKSGKTVTLLTFDDFISWKLDATWDRPWLWGDEQKELEKLVGDKLAGKRFTFETKVNVRIGDQTRDSVIRLVTYFGVDDIDPYKYALKNTDVFIYNGHSHVGYGVLDPANFTSDDFAKSYQLLWIDGCLSYNYYDRSYIDLKGGTKNVDVISNGLETPVLESGAATGRFIATFLGNAPASYEELLQAARATDRLRVVDGELDNVYSPKVTPIEVSAR